MPIGQWITNSTHTGSVTITKLDTVNNIVSGTFEFDAASTDDSAEPINVTDGRFDLKVQ
jgi:hypothetical protein